MYFCPFNIIAMFSSSYKSEQRKARFQTLCFNFEKDFLDKDEYGVKAFLKTFHLYHRNGKISNLCMSKSTDTNAGYYLFDYQYVVAAGNHVKRYKQTVFFVHDREMFLPEFLLKPEHVGHKIAAYFGWEDIDFAHQPHFSNTYHLSGDDETWIRDNFTDPVLSYFSKTSGWHVEAANHFLIFYAFNSLIPENILFDFYKMGKHVYALFKESQKELKAI